MSIMDVRLAVEALDAQLGDPYSSANACSWEQLCRNDEAGERPHEAEAVLKEIGVAKAFVPHEFNGLLLQLDRLGHLLRAVFRRDPALGLGFGVTSLMAAATIWTAGTAEQKERAAELLISGGQIAVAFHELARSALLMSDLFPANAKPDSLGQAVTSFAPKSLPCANS